MMKSLSALHNASKKPLNSSLPHPKPLPAPKKKAIGAKGGIAFSAHRIGYFCFECSMMMHIAEDDGEKEWRMKDDE